LYGGFSRVLEDLARRGTGFGPPPIRPPPPLRRLECAVANSEVDSDPGPDRPHKPRIIEDRVLTGAKRVDVKRLVHATVEEGAMDMDVEHVSVESECPLSLDTEVVGANPVPGLSRPLNQRRGRSGRMVRGRLDPLLRPKRN